jgi:hypothetical protein
MTHRARVIGIAVAIAAGGVIVGAMSAGEPTKPTFTEPPPEVTAPPPEQPPPEVDIPDITPPPLLEEDAPPDINPPPPVPEVDIPPIPPVDEEDPFKPREMPAPEAGPGPIEEGKRLFDREGRLELNEEGKPIYVFDSGDPSMRLLPCAWLEFIEKRTRDGRIFARWRVSGLVTTYRSENYLLLTKAIHIQPERDRL